MDSIRLIARFSFASLLALFFLTSAPRIAAQTTPVTAAAVDTMPVFHANADLVLVDVVVTDHGGSVKGLDRSHFHLLENGKERPIATFDEHKPADAPAVAAAPAELPVHTYTNVPVYPETGAVNVLLLDALNTPMVNQADVRRQMIQFMGQIKPGTSLAIFTLASQLRMVEGFTTDAAELTRALQGKTTTPQASVILDSKSDSGQQAIESTLADMSADPSHMPSVDAVRALQQFEADLTAFQLDQRVRITLDAMEQLARYLSAIPGRKNVIWFSGSFPITVDPTDDQPDSFQSLRNYSDAMRRTSELLTAARVAVYPVDARGMMTQSTADAAYAPSRNSVSVNSQGKMVVSSPALGDSNVVKDYQNFETQTMEEHESMQQIAEATGGKAYINTNDLKDAVASAVDNGASYYTIGFAPGGKKMDGHYRRLQIKLDEGHYGLSYRHGYYADATNKPSSHNPGVATPMQAATVHGAPPATQVIFKARVLASNDPFFAGAVFPNKPVGEMAASIKGPRQLYLVDLAVDAHFIKFENMPDGVHQAQLEFALVAYNADGKRVNFMDRSYAINVKPEDYQNTMAHGIRARLPIDLPAGQETLRVAVEDLAAGQAGSLEVPVAVTGQ